MLSIIKNNFFWSKPAWSFLPVFVFLNPYFPHLFLSHYTIAVFTIILSQMKQGRVSNPYINKRDKHVFNVFHSFGIWTVTLGLKNTFSVHYRIVTDILTLVRSHLRLKYLIFLSFIPSWNFCFLWNSVSLFLLYPEVI